MVFPTSMLPTPITPASGHHQHHHSVDLSNQKDLSKLRSSSCIARGYQEDEDELGSSSSIVERVILITISQARLGWHGSVMGARGVIQIWAHPIRTL